MLYPFTAPLHIHHHTLCTTFGLISCLTAAYPHWYVHCLRSVVRPANSRTLFGGHLFCPSGNAPFILNVEQHTASTSSTTHHCVVYVSCIGQSLVEYDKVVASRCAAKNINHNDIKTPANVIIPIPIFYPPRFYH